MALEIVDRQQKATILRDPAWKTDRRVANITIHDQHIEEAGLWVPTDETLALDGSDGFVRKSRRLRHALRIGVDGARRWHPRTLVPLEFASIGKPEVRLALGWQNLAIGSLSSVQAGTATWSRPNYDLVLSHNWHKVKMNIALKTEMARAVRLLRWKFDLVGLTYKDGALVSSTDAKTVGYLLPPRAWDATGKSIRVEWRYQAGYIIYQLNDADMDAAVLPVTIDPTFVDGYGGDVDTAKDTTLNDAVPTYNLGIQGELYAWTPASWLMQFDLSSLDSTVTVTSGTLSVYYTEYYGFDLILYRLATANSWIEGTKEYAEAGAGEPCYDYRAWPATTWAGSAGANTSDTDYDADELGRTTPAGAGSCDVSLVASMVKDWIDGTWTNTGIKGISNGKIASSDHATTGNRPSLTVVYETAAAGGPPQMMLMGVG